MVKSAVFCYRIWRYLKKNITRVYTAQLEGRLQFVPTFIIVLAVIITVFNLHDRQGVKSIDSVSLMSRLFNQVEELTVIESVSAQINAIPPAAKILAALESSAVFETDDTNKSLGEGIVPVADANGALLRPNLSSTEVAASRDKIIEYIVQPGDSVGLISDSYGISVATILWANNLSAHSIIKPGETLKILPTSGVMHVVKSGDTLLKIANKYDVEVSEITEANEIVSEHQLQISQALIVPGGKPPVIKTRTTRLANVGQIFSSTPAKASQSGFIWPTPSRRVTQYYWLRHKAIDVGGSPSNTLVASKAGRVEYSGWSNGYGYNVLINHGSGTKTRYAHMRQLWVKTGEQVQQGQALGKKGSTGRSTGTHVHFEIIINGIKVNPLSYL